MTKITNITLKIPDALVNRAIELSVHLKRQPEDIMVEWMTQGAEQFVIPPVDADLVEVATLPLYTIGHSNLSIEEFIEMLTSHRISVLVDVRSVPASNYSPHFNRAALERFLKDEGIAYRFAGDFLGGRPNDPSVYANQAVPDKTTKREDFLELVQYEAVMKTERYLKGLHGLLQIVQEQMRYDQHVAIMCSEGNPLECHRHHLIARSLIDPKVKPEGITSNVQVYHILRNKGLELVHPQVFEEGPKQQQLL